jgi:transcriptional regulator with XRE-family HTH domain
LKYVELAKKGVYNLANKRSVDKSLSRDFTEKTVTIMQVSDKLKFIRHIKHWSQEEVAHRLNISPSAYGSMERGETKLSLKRLEELAKIFEMDFTQLLDSSEKNIFNFGSIEGDHCQNWCDHTQSEQVVELKHELEKTRLLLQEREKEVAYLREFIELFKNNQKT